MEDTPKAVVAEFVATFALVLIGAGAVITIPALVMLLFAAAAALVRGGFSDPVPQTWTYGRNARRRQEFS